MKFAVINDARVLVEVLDAEPPKGVVYKEVPDDTDLHNVVGKMLFVEDASVEGGGVWTPILDKFPKIIRGRDPDALVAIALGFRAIAKMGVVFPPYTLAWLDTFKRYPDDMQPGDPLDIKLRS